MKNKGLASLAKKGRKGDDHVAHLQTGEMILPAPVLSEDTKQRLYQEMLAAGIDPEEYTVGGNMSINPETGLPEFGIGKSISKAVKKVGKSLGIGKVLSNGLGVVNAYNSIKNGDIKGLLAQAAPLALGPAGLGLTGSSLLAASALSGAGLGALSGGGVKGALGGALTGAANGGLGSYLGSGIAGATGLSGVISKGLGSAAVGAAGGALGGGDLKSSILSGGISGLGSLYQSGGFNNLGKSFKEGGLSNVLSQFGSNISGTGDILASTSGTAPSAAGGGTSSYSKPETINWDQGGSSVINAGNGLNYSPTGDGFYNEGLNSLAGNNLNVSETVNPTNLFDKIVNKSGDEMGNNRGLNSLLSAGIDTYSNNKAANELLKYQKQGMAALQPYLNQTWRPTDLENDPGYQFQLAQGTKAIDRAAAARGNYYSGDALRSAGEYAQGLADTTSQSAYQRWLQQQQNNVNNVVTQYGMLGDIGNTKATKTVNNANSWTDALSNYLQPQSTLEELLAKYRGQA